MKISVLVAVYNAADYLSVCLDSLVNQTHRDIQVICVDDASTDKTADIIREYEKKYPNIIKPIYQTENQYSKRDGTIGRVVTAACKGKYMAWCEGDDYWIDENKLQMQVDFLEGNPEYGMCFHGAEIIKEIDNDIALQCDLIEDRNYSATELFQFWIVDFEYRIFIIFFSF